MGLVTDTGPPAQYRGHGYLGPQVVATGTLSVDNTESLKYRPYLEPKDTETLRGIQPIKGTQLSSIQGSPNKFTRYKNKALHTRITAYSDQARHDLTFVSTSWRHPWNPTLGITLRKMSAMANTSPIVTTVTKLTTKEKTPKEADATPRVNIQDFCEEYYEDILPVIMDKIRRDKRKEVHARLDFEESPKKRRIREGSQNSSAKTLSARARSIDLVILTRQTQLNPHQTPGIVPTVEATFAGGTLLTEIVLGAETAPVASKSHMIIPAPPVGQGPNMDIARATETTPVMRKKGRESESPSSRVSESGTSDGGHWKSR
ncbi:hypothetical protein Tco_1375776 [Tanacetum coccineum]